MGRCQGLLVGAMVLVLGGLAGCHPAISPENHHLAIEHYNAGLRNLGQQKLQDAFWEFQYAEHLDPSMAKVHYSLGHVYYLMHDLPDSRKEFIKALHRNDQPSSTYNYLGKIALEQKDYPLALREFQEALKDNLNRTPYYPLANIGRVYMLMGNDDLAKEYFGKALLRKENFLAAHYWMGKIHMSEGAYEKALQDFSAAIRIGPNFSVGYYELGKAYLKLENPDKAARSFREAIRLDPDSKVAVKAKRYLLVLPKSPVSRDQDFQKGPSSPASGR